MSRYQNLFIFCWGIWLSLPSYSYSQYVSANTDSAAQVRQASFLQTFPFPEYTEFLSEATPANLVMDIEFLASHEGPVDLFLDSIHSLQMAYVREHPEDFDYILRQLRMGETLLQLDGIKKGFIFPAYGDLILQSITTHLDKGLSDRLYKSSNEEVQYIVRRLRENKFFVNVPVSDWQKGVDHLKSGNFGYLLRKVRLKQPVLFYGGILGFFLVLGTVLMSLRRKKLLFIRKTNKLTN